MTFKTVKRPEWINLFDAFKDRQYDDTITYPEMNKLLFDGDVRLNKRYVFERFAKEMLRQEQKALENLPNNGYRIAKPNEHIRLMNGQLRKAKHRLETGFQIVANTNRDKLAPREVMLSDLALARAGGLLATVVAEQKALSVEKKKISPPEIPRPKFQSP